MVLLNFSLFLLTPYLVVLATVERRLLKSPIIMIDFSIYFSSVLFLLDAVTMSKDGLVLDLRGGSL